MRSIVFAAVVCAFVPVAVTHAQTGRPPPALSGMSGDAAERFMERETNLKRLDDNVEGSRRTLRQYPAKPKDLLEGSVIRDSAGLVVGTITKVGSGFAVVASALGSVEVDVSSFARNKNGLLINLPKTKIDAMMAPPKPAR